MARYALLEYIFDYLYFKIFLCNKHIEHIKYKEIAFRKLVPCSMNIHSGRPHSEWIQTGHLKENEVFWPNSMLSEPVDGPRKTISICIGLG